jgi:hypothetical protein
MGAKAAIVLGDLRPIGAIPVPPNQQGNVWYVFQLDSRTGILRRGNTFNPKYCLTQNIVAPNQVPAFGELRPYSNFRSKEPQ